MNRSSKNKRLKILFYEPSSGFGGSSHFLASLINNLNRQEFQALVLIKNWGPQFEKIRDAEFIRLKNYVEPDKMSHLGFAFFFFRNILPEIIVLFFLIKNKKIDLVHVNTSIISGTPAIFASKLAGIPCICYVQQTKPLINRERFIVKFVDQFVIQNSYCLTLYKSHISENKLNLIYLGLDLNAFKKAKTGILRSEFKLNNAPLVGIVGRIVEGKGQKEFILAAKAVLQRKPETRFIIVGEAKGSDSAYFREVQELVKSESLENRVIFTGWRTDIEDVINDLDILVQASSTFPESFGLTITEAMVLGKPVVATNIPGPSEVVEDKVTGFLVPAANPQKLTEAILNLLDDKELARNFGRAAKQRVQDRFDITKIARQLECLYRKALK